MNTPLFMPQPHLFRGLSVALATPLTQKGDVDFDAWVRFLEFQIEGGVDHLVVCGTTGESPTISEDEYAQLVEVAVGVAAGRVRVIAGAGSNDTLHTIDRGMMAKEAGADGLLIVGPYYNKPPQRGLIAHFTAVADATGMPIIVYNVPGRSGSNLLPESMEILAGHPLIVAIKEASGDMNQILRVIASVPDHISVLAGDDSMTFPVIAAGGHGVISVAGNIYPAAMAAFTRACLNGEYTEALRMMNRFLPVFNAMFLESNPIPVKAALSFKGHMENVFRLPLVPIEDKHWITLHRVLENFDTLSKAD